MGFRLTCLDPFRRMLFNHLMEGCMLMRISRGIMKFRYRGGIMIWCGWRCMRLVTFLGLVIARCVCACWSE
ncbi:hypothetical protein D0Y65_040745 [Glycine soja]|uniref:Uncharacterized protein n=1 Tax=Glycine soja TaxID=3848 RepID=A0A445GSZ4_GLYSO|nr:hypothetical protein D0Y65_040745 [Glycine soja]